MRLLTVTANAAVDRTLTVPGWRKGEIARTDEILLRAGGKGLNVARAAASLGLAVTAVGLLGGATGEQIHALAAAEGLDTRWAWLEAGESRTCLILVDPDEPSATVLNEAGPTVTVRDWEQFAALTRLEAGRADVTAICGSLPPGVGGERLGAFLDALLAEGRAVAVDGSGGVLAEALRRPLWMVKANGEEFSAVVGQPVTTVESAVAVGRRLLSAGPHMLVVTLGEEGAVCVRPNDAWWARPPALRAVSTVGSGDSLLAGMVAGRLRGETWPKPLALGVACGTADALTIGGGLIHPNDVTAILEHTTVQRISIS